jgi:selT/selW/selH-like putative selenoprotein
VLPEQIKKILANKWMALILIFFIGNNIQSGLLTTGAFEISYNEELVYSKLQTGKMPELNGLVNAFA